MTTEATASDEPGQELSSTGTLAARAVALQRRADARVLVGVTGQPGSGKSTLAVRVAASLGSTAMVVPMDGFHLGNQELDRLGRRDRKGAPDTFDVDGFLELLGRLRSRPDEPVPFPEFDRVEDEPIPAAGEVPRHVSIVIVEGNYLLTQEYDWGRARPMFDEVWYVDLDPSERVRRLVGRHRQFGMTLEQATGWARGPDETNALLISKMRGTADVIVVADP